VLGLVKVADREIEVGGGACDLNGCWYLHRCRRRGWQCEEQEREAVAMVANGEGEALVALANSGQ
jgi:hypothetical protein